MLLQSDTDKQDQDLVAVLICGVRAAGSTKVSFAVWKFVAGMGTSENQHTSNVVDWYVETNQHKHMEKFSVQTDISVLEV